MVGAKGNIVAPMPATRPAPVNPAELDGRLCRASHVLDDRRRGAGGVVASYDRAADDEIIRTSRDRLRRGARPLVVVGGRAGEPNPRRGDQQPLLSRELANPVRVVVRRGDDAVAAALDRSFDAQPDQVLDTAQIAEFAQA